MKNNTLTLTDTTLSSAPSSYSNYSTTICCACNETPDFSAYAWESMVRATLKVLEYRNISTIIECKAEKLLHALLDTAESTVNKGKGIKV